MENASTLAKVAIAQLLSLHALACMGRASGNAEYFKAASEWCPKIESTIKSMRDDLDRQLGIDGN